MSAEDKFNEVLEEILLAEDPEHIKLLVDVIRHIMSQVNPQKYVSIWNLIKQSGQFDYLDGESEN